MSERRRKGILAMGGKKKNALSVNKFPCNTSIDSSSAPFFNTSLVTVST
jgi:hypothetical protein